MRITGYIEHPFLKITLFKFENKYSVKFETALFEQTYKIRTGHAIETQQDLEKMIDPQFIREVEKCFEEMHKIQLKALERFSASEGDDMPDII